MRASALATPRNDVDVGYRRLRGTPSQPRNAKGTFKCASNIALVGGLLLCFGDDSTAFATDAY
ncbi:MAG TPA: hypothetical protein VF207_04720 [Chthoniobacterales bacterium]